MLGSSMLMLEYLAHLVEPSYYEKLIEIAKLLKDDHLEGVVRKAHSYASMRQQQYLRLGSSFMDDLEL